MTSNAPITELDFNQIKTNLKTYLKGQAQFADYNFEGSNMNVLLDVLSYNTYQNGFFTNMAMNEMFLDSAQLPASVVSHAKALNYVPRSRTSAKAKINVTLACNDTPTFVIIPEKTRFVAKCGTKTFNFYSNAATTIYPVNGVYTYFGLEVYEGRYVDESFLVTGSTQKYALSNSNIDTSSIRVYVKESSSSTTETEYTRQTSLFGAVADSTVFYIQAQNDTQYELIFGENIFGIQPANGNVVRVEYRVTAGEEANDIISFVPSGNIQGYPATSVLNQKSADGYEKEGIESIRYFAPRAMQVQDRAVTEHDYEILLKNYFPEIQAVSVYGGEELNPPRYGKVIIAVDVQNAYGVSENNKVKYATYLRDRSPVAIQPIVVSPEFMYVAVDTNVYFDTKKTASSEASIRQSVLDSILAYNDANLNNFKTVFRASRLSATIDEANPNILSNDLSVLAIIPLNPPLNLSSNFDITFNNALNIDHSLSANEVLSDHRPAVKSSTFTYDGSIAFIQDNGNGVLQVIKSAGASFVYLNANIGSVDYETGRVIIKKFNVSAYDGTDIRLYGRTRTSTIEPPKNRILTIREQDITINVAGVN